MQSNVRVQHKVLNTIGVMSSLAVTAMGSPSLRTFEVSNGEGAHAPGACSFNCKEIAP
jgi:hypothetical protein